MPDAIITSTESTFGTISGTFAADQSTVTGTIAAVITGTLTGSVGVPGPQGIPGEGVPAGGTAGQFLQKTTTGVDYATDWVTVNLGNYLVKSNNLSDLTNFSTARDNLGLGSLNTPTFAGVNVPGSGTSVANLGATLLTLNQQGHGQFTIQPSSGITFPDTTVQATAFNASVLLPYAPLNSPLFTGDPRGPTAALGDNDTSLATTAFVQQELASGVAVAKNLEVLVRNQSGSTIAAGAIVYISGATGNKPLITLAQANNDANSAQTMGFVKTAIANNGTGYVIVRGELENIDTSALTEGVQLYLSPTTPGAWTTTKPSAPQHLVYVGIVVRSHPTQGVILVAVQNGYELNELHDVAISSPTNGQVLKYDSSTGLWYNGTDSSGVAWGGITGTLSSQTDLQSALDAKQSVSGMTAYLTKADNLGSLTNFGTARSNLGLGSLDTPTFAGVNVPGSGTSVANLGATFLTINQQGSGQFTIQPSQGIVFPDATIQTTAYPGPVGATAWGTITGTLSSQTDLQTALDGKYSTSNPAGYITSSALTPYLTSATAASTYQTIAGMSSYLTTSAAAATYQTQAAMASYATESWVTSQGYLTDAPSDGNQYARKDGAWDIVSAGTSYITSVTSPLTVTSGDLSIDLTGYATESWVTSQGYITSVTFYPLTQDIGFSTSPDGRLLIDGVYDPTSSGFTSSRINIGSTTPSAPLNGDFWSNGSKFRYTLGGTTYDIASESYVTTRGYITSSALSPYLLSSTAASTYQTIAGMSSYLTTASAASTYQTISGMSSYLTTSAAASTYLTQANAASTYFTIASAASKANLASPTFTGKVTTAASATGGAGFNIPHGTAPTSPVNGDIWTTTTGLFARVNSVTRQYVDLDGTQTINGTKTFSAASQTFGNSTASGTINIGTGATVSGSTKALNLGTGGVAGSTTTITIGSNSGGTSTTTLQGTTNGVTAAADTNSTALATTAFVVGQAGSATPLVNGTAAVGTSLRYARQDHVHPTDTSRAALASPTFTGTPAAPTAAVDTNTTQIATTAYVVGQGYAKLASPALTGTPTAPTATAGTNTTQIATTAFVQAAVPALATLSDARQFTNDTKAMSPRDVIWSMLTPDFVDISGPSMTVTNTGTITYVNVGQLSRVIRPGTAGACSSRIRTFGTSQVDQTWTASSRAQPSAFLNFSLRSIHSGRSTTSGVTDANYTCAFYYGKAEADGVGNLVRRGFGWKMVGGAGSRFLELQAHNGTTLSSVTSSFAVTAGVAFDWDIESDGAGNVTLYVNGTSVATSSGGPTGAVNITGVAWQEEVVAAAALSSPYMDFTNSRGRYIVINTW